MKGYTWIYYNIGMYVQISDKEYNLIITVIDIFFFYIGTKFSCEIKIFITIIILNSSKLLWRVIMALIKLQ